VVVPHLLCVLVSALMCLVVSSAVMVVVQLSSILIRNMQCTILKKNRKKNIVVEFLEIKTRETKTFVPKSMFCDQNTLFSNEITAV
jgi:hypothetical protein